MFKLSSFFLSVCFVIFIAWTFMPTDVHVRLERACKPVDWAGNIVLSMTAFVYPSGQASVDAFFKKTDYACQYSIWRLIYEEDWKSQQQTMNNQ
jgi:hypothetical protein